MNEGSELEEAFVDSFGSNPPERFNKGHELIVVASDLDPSTERIISYLADNYGVPESFFVAGHGICKRLSRADTGSPVVPHGVEDGL